MSSETDGTGLSISGALSEEWTHRQNIRSFRAQLGRERSEARRATLARLLAEEERRLEGLASRAKRIADAD